jgi:hypothetical protein
MTRVYRRKLKDPEERREFYEQEAKRRAEIDATNKLLELLIKHHGEIDANRNSLYG